MDFVGWWRHSFAICEIVLIFALFNLVAIKGHWLNQWTLFTFVCCSFPFTFSPTWVLPFSALSISLLLHFIHVNIHGPCAFSWLPKTTVWKRNQKTRGTSATQKLWQILPPTGTIWAPFLRPSSFRSHESGHSCFTTGRSWVQLNYMDKEEVNSRK